MGRQQFEVLKGVVRRTLERKFCNSPRSATDEVVGAIDGAKKPAQNSDSGSALNPRSQVSSSVSPSSSSSSTRTLAERVLKDYPSVAPIFFVVSENLRPLHQEGLEGFFPSQLRRSLYINFSLGPSSVLTPVSNVVGGFGSVPTVTRGFASLSGEGSKAGEKVGELEAADGPRGEGQGGDEGLTASVSGREAPVKKPRRRKAAQLIESGREVGIGADASKKEATKVISDPKELVSTVGNFQSENVVPRNIAAVRRKRNKEVVSVEDASLEAAGVDREPSNVHLANSLPSELQSSPKASPIFGMDLAEEIPAPGNVPAVASEKIRHAFSDSDSDLEKYPDSEKGSTAAAVSKCSGAVINLNEQELRMTSFTSVVEEHLKDLHKQNTAKSMGKDSGDPNQNEHLRAGGSLKSGSGFAVDSHVEGADYTDPTKVYRILQGSRGGRSFQGQEKGKLNSIFYRFSVSGWVSDQALSLYINSKFFPTAAARFRKFFMHRSSPELRSYVVAKGPTNDALQFLFPSFAEFCIQEFSDEIRRYRELVSTADMTKPDAWYPFARAMKRKVIYHKGPTNSGKTYKALKRLMEAQSGIYCSPLRLLAMEVFDTVNMQGVYCNLHTGQEKKDVPFANHLACTIEMCYLNKQWGVAVIDEIQMMSDEYRGWAWTRAFLGLQADEIHVCGDPSALPLIRNLCAGTGDELVENEYERFKPLKVSEESLRGDFRNIQAGDCIVAFSRRDIFDIKREVELATKHRCCVVYGALPPETRTQQAKLFNEQDNGYDVLVASDAIGMGLNLNIRRVVFFSLDKFDGDSKKPVPPAQVKQIAGRAGRRGSIYPEGVTTTFFSQDLPYLGSSLVQDFEPSTAAGLFPVYEQVELFASQLPNENFAKLLERFSETCKLDGAYFLCRYDNLKRVANMLEKVKGLSLEDRFNFCFAPVNVRDPQSMGALYRYATAFSQKIPVHVEMGVPSSSARDEFELLDLEARHQLSTGKREQVLSMYLWLSQHFPGDLFPQREEAGEMASQIAVLLGQSLVQSSRRWSKRKLPPTHNRGRPPPNMGTTFNRKNTSWKKVETAENVLRV